MPPKPSASYVLGGLQRCAYKDEMPEALSESCRQWLEKIAEQRIGFDVSRRYPTVKERVKLLSGDNDNDSNKGSAVLYWMNRDQRVQDNWAMLFAQKLGVKFKLPLHVCYLLNPQPVMNTKRHMRFMLEGLKLVEKECNKLNISFHLLHKNQAADSSDMPATTSKKRKRELDEIDLLVDLIEQLNAGIVVTDFSPLREEMEMVEALKKGSDASLIQVDAHNVVPCWLASDKLEYGARTIRKKIHDHMATLLTQFPDVYAHPHKAEKKCPGTNWLEVEQEMSKSWDETCSELVWCQAGYERGMQVLHDFMLTRLEVFNDVRNNPAEPALSHISPWLRFGQVSAQRYIFEVAQLRERAKLRPGVEVFVEEALVRRELADNFCYYAPGRVYDQVEGAWNWAQETLKLHAKDKRDPAYTEAQMENAQTGDDLWNASQQQLLKTGKIHGFLRMYWCKKILEWHADGPEAALKFAIYLNDHYSIDGHCPNGFTGVMWSICGVHDQGWGERPIFGKIRFMNYKGCERKFDVQKFVKFYQNSKK